MVLLSSFCQKPTYKLRFFVLYFTFYLCGSCWGRGSREGHSIPALILRHSDVLANVPVWLSAVIHMRLVPLEARRGHWIPRTRVMGSCEPPRGAGGWNLGPLEKQPALLTAEPPLQPHSIFSTVKTRRSGELDKGDKGCLRRLSSNSLRGRRANGAQRPAWAAG